MSKQVPKLEPKSKYAPKPAVQLKPYVPPQEEQEPYAPSSGPALRVAKAKSALYVPPHRRTREGAGPALEEKIQAVKEQKEKLKQDQSSIN